MNIQKIPSFYLGVVEDRFDPLKLGRVKVRIMGLHTHDKAILPTEDLPWAYKIQPTTSGAMTGIGHSPVGVVEGTWVAIQFIDPDQQMPFVVGTFGGTPQSLTPPLESFELLNSETNVEVQAEESQVPLTDKEVIADLRAVSDDLPVKSAREFSVSEDAISFIKNIEKYRADPYKDSAGVWTIGYGSTILADGSAVSPTTGSISQAQADTLLRNKIKSDFEPAVKSSLRAPITQSMFDACVSLAYNIGGSAFSTSSVVRLVNSGDYASGAEAFLLWNKAGGIVLDGLTRRRAAEKALFLKNGIPQKDGSLVETPQSMAAEQTAIANSDAGIAESNPASVSTTQYTRRRFNGQLGFKDPNNKYPLTTHLNEPDTNRLARRENIRNTIVYFKESAEHRGVSVANSAFPSWNQSKTPYNAQYPFNHVWQTEAGHIQEWDDTPGNERIHTYHTKGTFWEVDHNGTMVRRTVGDDYTILERNGYVHIIGNAHVCVEGAKTLKVADTLDIEVNGKTTINVHDTAIINAGDDLVLTAAGNMSLNVGGNFGLNVAGNIDVKAGGNHNISAGAASNIQAGAIHAVDASSIIHNTGASSPATPPSPSFTNAIGSQRVMVDDLLVNTRGDEDAMLFETPEDGTPEELQAYKQQRIENGTATVEDLTTKPTVQEQVTPSQNNIPVVSPECGIPAGTTTFNYQEKISKYFTLAQLTHNGSRKLVAQNGLRADQIYCSLKALATNILDPLYEKYSNLTINSGFRLGNASSQHNKGQAVDISFPGMTRAELYTRCLEIQKLVPYDQLILEYASGPGWIHISFNPSGNRVPPQQFTMNNHSRASKDVYTIAKIY